MAHPLSQRLPSTLHDMRNMTGDEAFAARCAMGSAHYAPQSQPPYIKEEDNEELHITGMGMSRHTQFSNVKLEPLEEGEIKDGHASHLISTIVQTQRRESSKWYNNPAPSSHSSKSTPVPGGSPQSTLPMQPQSHAPQPIVINGNDPLPGLDPQDRLDPRIWIRPRSKTSKEVQLMMSHEWNKKKADQVIIPEAIRRITHQFMVANGFVASRDHLPKTQRKKLWQSLLLRLDMETGKNALKASSELGKRLASAAAKLSTYIERQSLLWHDMGILILWPTHFPPQFHPCTKRWVLQSWNGQVRKDNLPQIDEIVAAVSSLHYDELLFMQEKIGVALKREGAKLYNPTRSSFCPLVADYEQVLDSHLVGEEGSNAVVKGEDSGYGS